MKKTCFIVGAGEYSECFVPDESTYIIAADAGYETLISTGINPDLVVGDFDSVKNMPVHSNIITVPTEKNDTDMSLAIKHGLSHGCKTFIIDGGLGGRLDHTIANIQLLKMLSLNNAVGVLLGKELCLTAITNSQLEFNNGLAGIVSVFTPGEKAEGVTLKGLKYPLDNYTLTDTYPIGVSNEFTDNINTSGHVSVQNGTLIITWTTQPCALTFNSKATIKLT